MKPIKLNIRNFGPYCGTNVVIEFDHLDRIFLICGDTGAGKTTLFDAMAYALYGSPLGTRDGDSVRSQFAVETDSTLVEFQFATSTGTYRVLRSPHFFTPKKRGEGFNQAAELLEAYKQKEDGSWSPLTETKTAKAINAELVEVVGFSFEHFAKLVVLPQGEFQKFLEMDTKNREDLLRLLFPVETHERLAAMAEEKAKEVRQQESNLQTLQQELRRSFTPEGAEAVIKALRDTFDTTTKKHKKAESLHAKASRSLIEAQHLTAEFDQQASLLEEQKGLAHQEVILAPSRLRIESDLRAQKVVPILRERQFVHGKQTESAKALAEATERFATANDTRKAAMQSAKQLPALKVALESARQSFQALSGQADQLRNLLDSEKAWNEASRKVREARKSIGDLQQEQAKVKASLAALDPVARELDSHKGRRDVLVQQVAVTRLHEKDARSWQTIVGKNLSEARASLKKVQDELRQAEKGLADAQALLCEAEAGRNQARAAEMALQLLDGQACPVCGSLDHPAPAKAHEDQPVWVSLIEARASLVEMKREACTTHREQRSRAEFNIKRLDQEAEALQRDLASAGFSAAADVLERLETLAAQSRQLDDAIKPLEQLLATRPGLEAEANKALLALEKATLHREALDRALAQLEGERVQLAKGAGDPEDPAAALRSVQADLRTRQQGLLEQDGNIQAIETAQHKAEVDLASRTAEQAAAAQTMEGFDTRLRELEAACTIGLKESAFPSADLALAALLPDGDRDQLMETLQVHQAAASRISHLLEDLARRLNDRDRPDLETLADLEKAALVERTEAQAAREIASRNLDQHREWSERWLELEQQWKELQEQGGIYVQLAADLNGQGKGGKEKLSFSSFVLGRWLARVLDKATLHLLALTGGRYRFLHKDLEEDRRKKAGLDIDIHDAHSGAARAVTTLSGGEKFLASLSLALGLSDVIQAWSGGRRLEALFIDEGFGSLDGESLDKALAVLEGIGGGRQVGIISHVEGLKAILESRIEVEKGLAGSKVRIVNRAPAVE